MTIASPAAEPATLRDLALRGQSLRDLLVIDGHCHVGPAAPFYQPHNAAAELVRTMDRIGIDRACIFSTMAVFIDTRAGNDLTLAAAREFPDRLIPYVVVDPNRDDEVPDELQRCFDAGARGVKFHTSLHDYPFDGPGYEPAFAFAHEHRLPLISHGVGTPETLRRIARGYPGAHVIAAHVGGGPVGPEDLPLLAVAREEPNVYLDLANSVAHYGAFARMVEFVGARKLLYGSDAPWACFTYQIGRVLLAPIAEADKRAILGGNLAALLDTRR